MTGASETRLVRLYSPAVVGRYASRVAIERQMIRLGPGKFPVAGSQLFGDKKPANEYVNISQPFLLGRYGVTVAEYREFSLETGHGQRLIGDEAGVKGQQDELLFSDAKLPVVFVNKKDDVFEYHNWLINRDLKESGGDIKISFGLPSAAQWELAARGEAGREYPFGDWDGHKLNHNSCRRSPVDAHQAGETPEGVEDLAGNVWEWVGTNYGDYDPSIITDPQGPKEGNPEVRGGSAWFNFRSDFRGAGRAYNYSEYRNGGLGFRSAGT